MHDFPAFVIDSNPNAENKEFLQIQSIESLKNEQSADQIVKKCMDEYFLNNWDRVDQIYEANIKYFQEFYPLKDEFGVDEFVEIECKDDLMSLEHVDQRKLQDLMEKCAKLESIPIILLLFVIEGCEACSEFTPKVVKAKKLSPESEVVFCCVDGKTEIQLRNTFSVEKFPDLVAIRPTDGKLIARFPREERTTQSILKFVQTTRSNFLNGKEISQSVDESLEIYLKRKFVKVVEIFRALGCYDEYSCLEKVRVFSQDDPPSVFFLGGGMGAGKSTAVRYLLANDLFMQKYAKNVVVVEADALKIKDPMYQSLSRKGIKEASSIVHAFSTDTAESLFLSAIHWKRDIVFDGTLTWFPFVKQTINMVRDNQHIYKKGPGYQGDQKPEIYWEVDQTSAKKQIQPYEYKVRLIGVFCRPEQAIKRGILRWLRTNRKIDVKSQLRSHKLFAQNFPLYIDLFDQIDLFSNMNEDSQTPTLIAQKKSPSSPLEILDPDSYAYFLNLSNLNISANSSAELFQQFK